MSAEFSLEFLQGKIGAEYVELTPVTGKPRIIQGLNEVWGAVDEHGGVPVVARLFGLSEADVWGWIDAHWIPEPYVFYMAGSRRWIPDVLLSSVGWEDPVSGACWPSSWKLDRAEIDFAVKRRKQTTVER